MKREHKQRPVSFDDIARSFVKDLPLEDQLTVSVFYGKVRAAFEAEKKQQAAEAVVDFKRGWAIKEGA